MEVTTKNAEETKELGRKVGSKLGQKRKDRERRIQATVLALTGELGSGKTTFLQGLAEGLGIKKRIISPTFIIIRTYDKSQNTNDLKVSELKTFHHIDLYRIEGNIGDELKNLGMDEIFSDPANVVAIEWAEKAKDYLPENTTWINFSYKGQNMRSISSVSKIIT
jgi:tRNA threonylcarbamoyladenosine biosynthesis protein TsaE